jgi:hypothetical protein
MRRAVSKNISYFDQNHPLKAVGNKIQYILRKGIPVNFSERLLFL